MKNVDCSYLQMEEPKWLPYFGNQRREANFAVEIVRELNLPKDATFAETNSGSHAISLAIRKQLGLSTLSNDISLYSFAVGRALNQDRDWEPCKTNNHFLRNRFGSGELFDVIDQLSTEVNSPVQAAALGATLAHVGGYDFEFNDGVKNFPHEIYNGYLSMLNFWSHPGGHIIREDLMDFLDKYKANVVYMDFAWPWRDGREVQEYGSLSDICSGALSQQECGFELWTKDNVVSKVLDACSLAVVNFDYVILSNQSSNFPTPDILESALLSTSAFRVINMKTLSIPAQEVDNRGLDDWFTEYQYLLVR